MGVAPSIVLSILAVLTFTIPLTMGADFGVRGEFFWGLTNANMTETCILLTGIFEIAVPYDTSYYSKSIAIVTVPRNASIQGSCESSDRAGVEMQSMILIWSPDPKEPNFRHELSFSFRKNAQPLPFYELSEIKGRITSNLLEFPGAMDEPGGRVYEMMASHVGMMGAPQGMSYYCKSTQLLDFDDGENIMDMAFVHAEAFNNKIALDASDFGPKSFCAKDGFEVLLMVLLYLMILSLIGLAIFFTLDKRSKRHYIYF